MKSENYHKMLVLKTKTKHFMDHWNASLNMKKKTYRITTLLIPKESNGHHTLPPNHGVIGIYAWAWPGLNSHLDLRGLRGFYTAGSSTLVTPPTWLVLLTGLSC